MAKLKTIRVNVVLGEKQHDFLKRRAEEKGLNVSILLRQLVERLMEETEGERR